MGFLGDFRSRIATIASNEGRGWMNAAKGTSEFGRIYGAGLPRPQRGSSIVLRYGSALQFWRRVRCENARLTRGLIGTFYPDELLLEFDAESLSADSSLRPIELPSECFERIVHTATLFDLNAPVDVIVGRRSARRDSSSVKCHVWSGPIPDGLLACIAPGVYVPSPELIFAQMAQQLGLYRAIALAMELCGTYAINACGGCDWDVTPLTCAERIRRILSLSESFRGRDIARQASLYVIDGSASPMETSLAIALSLPRRLGGWGCSKPVLNARVELDDAAKRECGSTYLVADLLFERAGLDIEYQGREWHSSLGDRASDERRQNALMMMGLSCVFVSREQIGDVVRIDGIADLIRKRAGLERFRESPTPQMLARRDALMDALGLFWHG